MVLVIVIRYIFDYLRRFIFVFHNPTGAENSIKIEEKDNDADFLLTAKADPVSRCHQTRTNDHIRRGEIV